jgi:hypothetical protein
MRKSSHTAFLLRLWCTQNGQKQNWLASLEDPHTHQVTGFDSLAALYSFLENFKLKHENLQTNSDAQSKEDSYVIE